MLAGGGGANKRQEGSEVRSGVFWGVTLAS